MMTTSEPATNARQKSPSYPSYPLEQALVAVRKIYDKDRRVASSRDIAAKHMGYTATSGSGLRMLATLSQFALILGAGNGKIRVSELAESLLHPRDKREKATLLLQALHSPKLFGQLIDEHGLEHLPSDENLRSHLVRTYHFSPTTADDFLRCFRHSVAYVRDHASEVLSQTIEASQDDEVEDEDIEVKPAEQQSSRADRNQPAKTTAEHVVDGPLSSRTRVELSIYGPLGKAEAQRLKVWLERIVQPWAEFRILEAEDEEEG
jgi:hypothetical protein